MEIISNNRNVNTVTVEFKSSAEEFEKALQETFLKKRRSILVPGFRKGKATRKIIEKTYGEEIFYEDAINDLFRKMAADAARELELDVLAIENANTEVLSIDKNEGVLYKVDYIVKPVVTLNNYKGLKAVKTVKTITEDDINNELKKLQEKNARIVDIEDRKSMKGDIANLDFKGYIDDEPFDGGSAEDYELEIGSGKFIPGFEDQLVDRAAGEEFDVNVTFPENYNVEELKGKPAVFKCVINRLQAKEYPEIDDEMVKDISEFDTLDQLKNDIRVKLEEAAVNDSEVKVENDILMNLVSEMQTEIPQIMFEERINELVREWEYRNRSNGFTLDDYLRFTNTTLEQFRENFREYAEKQVKIRLALEKIAELENIEVTGEEIENEFEKIAELYNTDVANIKKSIPEASIREDLRVSKALNMVKDSAVVTEE